MNDPLDQQEYQARQRARSKVMAFLLLGFVVLIFAISIVKMKVAG